MTHPGPNARDLPDSHDNAWGPYHETPPGISELAVAADLAVAGAVRESGAPSYGPPHPYYLAGGGCLLVLVVLLLLVFRDHLRRRRRPGA